MTRACSSSSGRVMPARAGRRVRRRWLLVARPSAARPRSRAATLYDGALEREESRARADAGDRGIAARDRADVRSARAPLSGERLLRQRALAGRGPDEAARSTSRATTRTVDRARARCCAWLQARISASSARPARPTPALAGDASAAASAHADDASAAQPPPACGPPPAPAVRSRLHTATTPAAPRLDA